jgi:tetratricopeptide (TPR) repeat protein
MATRRAPAILGAASALLAAACLGFGGTAVGQETSLTSEERAKLDTFEGVSIDKADKVFAAQEWPRAVAEYDAFIVQFPESKVTPYAILRKGRSLQAAQKRFEAVKVYQEVLDFFPDDVKYAAAALYRIGESHAQNGDVPKAMKAWFDLSEDPDYVKEPLGAAALNGLAENLIKQGKADEGIGRFEQVAVEFRLKNSDAARAAIARVVPHHVRTKPDNKKLRDFYVAVKTFHHGPHEPGADVATDAGYWAAVRQEIGQHARFTDVQKEEREAFYRYWAGQLQGKLPANDDQQNGTTRPGRSGSTSSSRIIRRPVTSGGSSAGSACSPPTSRRPTSTTASSTSPRCRTPTSWRSCSRCWTGGARRGSRRTHSASCGSPK